MAQTSTQREMTMAAPMGQWRATYAPGTSLILAGPTSLVLLREPGTAQERLVNALWEQVMRSATMGELAARLAVFSIDKLPGFAALFWTSKGMRSLVRGDVTVTDPSSGNVVASGSDIQTWSESGLGNLTRVSVITGEEAEPGPVLPLVVGVAYASWVCLDASADAQVRSPQEIPEEELEYTSPVSLAAASRNPAASSTSPVVLSVSQDRSSTAAAAPAGDLAAAPSAPVEGPPMGSAAPSAPAEGPPMDSSAQAVPAETAPMSSTVEGLADPPTEPFAAGPLSTTSEDPWGSDDDGPDTEPMPAVEDGDQQPLQVGLAVDRSTDSREADLESKSAGVADDNLEADTQLMEVPIEHPAFNPQLDERQQAAAPQAAMPPPVAADVDDTPPLALGQVASGFWNMTQSW